MVGFAPPAPKVWESENGKKIYRTQNKSTEIPNEIRCPWKNPSLHRQRLEELTDPKCTRRPQSNDWG